MCGRIRGGNLLTVAAKDSNPRRIGAHHMMGPPLGHEAPERMADRDRSAPGRHEADARLGRRVWEPQIGPSLTTAGAHARGFPGMRAAMAMVALPGRVLRRAFVRVGPRPPASEATLPTE